MYVLPLELRCLRFIVAGARLCHREALTNFAFQLLGAQSSRKFPRHNWTNQVFHFGLFRVLLAAADV